jgi:peptidyl-prolyl cis-trans isomerase SurA
VTVKNQVPYAVLSVLAVILLSACSGSRGTAGQQAAASDVLAEIDGQPVTVAEFESQYLRAISDTAQAVAATRDEYEDFLNRYVDFRLKVLEAERLGYGQLADLNAELETYRGQLARPYLLEREVTEPLVRQLYERRAEMIDVSHILIRVAENASPEDTLRAYGKLSAVADSIAGGADFGVMALRHSEDPSARAAQGSIGYQGRLGYFTAGRMVAPFEDRMYTTPVGGISPVFRTQFGYHVLKVHGRRPTVPDRRISHIMIQPRGPSEADSADAAERLGAALGALGSGQSFAAVAAEYSNDVQTAQRGGDLDYIAYDGWLPVEMRDVAFAADSVGAVLGPVRTRFGWHLMQVTDVRRRPSLDESYEALQTEVARMPRSRQAEMAFARSLRQRYDARVDSSLLGRLRGTFEPDSLLTSLRAGTVDSTLLAMPFATVADSTWPLSQFAGFLGTGGARLTAETPDGRFREAVDAWLDDRAIAYEITALQERDADFARTMREFRDGLMLFRLMEDSVWNAAATDSLALVAYHEAHVDSFRFGERHRILSIGSPSDSLLQAIAAELQGGSSYADVLSRFASDPASEVRFDTTFVEGSTDSVFDRAIALEPGQATGVVGFGSGRIILVNDGLEPPRTKTFEEARAEVVGRYQAIIEERLMDRLRAEHGARLYPERLDRVFAGVRSRAAVEVPSS